MTMPATDLPKILVVDDEATLKTALCTGLQQKGYDTTGFTSPKDALAALRLNSFDVMLTDLMMPEMDGIALLKEAQSIDPNLVSIVLTGDATIPTAVEAMKVGAMDYVLKPFKLSVILPLLTRAGELRVLRLEKAALDRRLRDRTAELESANRELKAANEELNAFVSSVSHDLRAPLRAINFLTTILVGECSANLSSEGREILDKVLANSEKMRKMMDALLRLSRIGHCQLSKEAVSISDLVKDILHDLRNEQEACSIDIQIGQLPDCIGDPALLRQALFNLLSNAFKFSKGTEKPRIEIGCELQPTAKVYFIRDNGVGFDMKDAHKLFAVFQRLHGEQEFEGTGIGLSIVRRIIERHDGRIWAQAAAGQGATFYFTLPDR